MLSKREIMEGNISQLMGNYEANWNQIAQLLFEYKRLFPVFKFSLELKKKEQLDLCSGYCMQSKTKYHKSSLLFFNQDHPHLFCSACVVGWIQENLNNDPTREIQCQRCVSLNKSGPAFLDSDICNLLQITEQQLYEHRSQFSFVKNSKKCSNCSGVVSINEEKKFLCTHEYCSTCLYHLIVLNLNSYYNLITNPANLLDEIPFQFYCHNNCNVSVDNDLTKNLLQNLQVYQEYEDIRNFIQFVSRYPKYFAGKSYLSRCLGCRFVFEKDGNMVACKNCSKCICGKLSHPGINCGDLANKSDKYVLDKNFMLPQPPEGDQSIVKIFAILSAKMEEFLQVPRRIAKVWKVHNEVQDFFFSFAKTKKNLMSSLMLDAEYQSILQNNFQLDEKNFFSFFMKNNNFPEKKFMFYLEIMYDEDLGPFDPDKIDETKKNSRMLFFTHAGRYCLNNIRSIRILYLIQLI